MPTNTKKPQLSEKPSEKPGGAQQTDQLKKTGLAKPAAKDRSAERRGSMAALAINIPAITRAAIGSRGFAEAGLITHWAEIVGADLARGCQPDMLRFPKGERSGGTLTLRCIGAMAVEIQHQMPVLIERINGYFGYRAIAKLQLVQGSLRRKPMRAAFKLPSLAPGEKAAAEASLTNLPESDVKDALRRLGETIWQRSKLPPRR